MTLSTRLTALALAAAILGFFAYLSYLAFLAKTCCGVGPGPKPTPESVVARACRNDTFFVDVPSAVPLKWSKGSDQPGSWREILAKDLEAKAKAAGMVWFEEDCPESRFRVHHFGVLPQRSASVDERSFGHDRFHRFRFECGRDPLPVKGQYLCEVVEALRLGVPDRRLVESNSAFVGRECDALPAGYEKSPTPQMKVWHYDVLGLVRGSPAAPSAAQNGSVAAQLAIVDAGLAQELWGDFGVEPSPDFVNDPGFHSHGAAMVAYARQVAPGVKVFAPRVMDANGRATSVSIARALDDAIFSLSDPSQPLVLGLSFGWNPKLSERAELRGLRTLAAPTTPFAPERDVKRDHIGGCRTFEDPFGEPVRYVLALARQLDESGARRILSVAAAGNRSGDPSTPIHTSLGANPFPPFTGVSPPSRSPAPLGGRCYPTAPGPLFYPAAYEAQPTCLGGEDKVLERTVMAVSAIAGDRRPATNAIPGSETSLVAIGEHVIADAPPNRSQHACVPSTPRQAQLPASLSGSSVSAAFVAAAAARAQGALVFGGRSPASATGLARLLELSGVRLCRTTAGGQEVRRLDVGRLDRATSDESCGSLVNCAVSGSGSCSAESEACWGMDHAACDEQRQSPPLTPLETAACGLVVANRPRPSQIPTTASCPPAGCTLEAAFEKYHVGGTGPQPPAGGCPWCPATLTLQGGNASIEAVFELSPEFEPVTYFEQPQLVLTLYDALGTKETLWIDLLEATGTYREDWTQGKTIVLKGPLAITLTTPPVEMEAELHTVLVPPGPMVPVVDVSPMVSHLVIQ